MIQPLNGGLQRANEPIDLLDVFAAELLHQLDPRQFVNGSSQLGWILLDGFDRTRQHKRKIHLR